MEIRSLVLRQDIHRFLECKKRKFFRNVKNLVQITQNR